LKKRISNYFYNLELCKYTMKAVILCAGFGTRMRPYTENIQKAMIPVHGKPLLEYIIEGIKTAGFREFIIVVGYRKEDIINHFKDGEAYGIKIEYVEQKELNGTGGALLLCQSKIKEDHFFLTWGDILVPYQVYQKVIEVYRKENQNFILVTNYVEDPYKGCAIYTGDRGKYLKNVVEKPPKGTSKSNLNNCGIFILSKEIFKMLKEIEMSKRGELEIPKAIKLGLIEKDWNIRVIKMEKNTFRGDFGDKNKYEKLNTQKKWLKELKS
jgi:UDP-N-acetylglucosamine diphosphorylase / glucose-1-phosphate thymidylyltransferase / UDP-N-acetylgalactosamine diphosphorylase / glucosamine-1-phosphate N-acetyltransferase / galactosamine-1-phosphate N-acetyltransferase